MLYPMVIMPTRKRAQAMEPTGC